MVLGILLQLGNDKIGGLLCGHFVWELLLDEIQ
jgi:hypothetical protein